MYKSELKSTEIRQVTGSTSRDTVAIVRCSRNVVIISCLVVVTMFASCDKNTSVKFDIPQVGNITFTECNNGIHNAMEPAFPYVDVTFTSNGVSITHYNLDVNCAFDTVLVTPTYENGILTISEQGEPNNANCICSTDVSYTISGISEENIDKIVINGEVVWTANQESANLLIGKWHTSDNNSGNNDTIHFTADMRVEDYFMFVHTAMYPASSYYFTYSLTENTVTITSYQPENAEFSETFNYILNGNLLTIKGFSNPFSITEEARTDVHFTKIE